MHLGLLTTLSNYTTYDNGDTGSNMFAFLVWLAVVIFMIAAIWTVYVKAKKPGWAAIIPFYNAYVLIKIVNRPGWWLVLYFIPPISFVIHIIVMNDLSKAFGKDVGYTLLLVLLPFLGWPLLAWGDAKFKKVKKSKK